MGNDQKNWGIQLQRNGKSGIGPMAMVCCGDEAVALFSRDKRGRVKAELRLMDERHRSRPQFSLRKNFLRIRRDELSHRGSGSALRQKTTQLGDVDMDAEAILVFSYGFFSLSLFKILLILEDQAQMPAPFMKLIDYSLPKNDQ